MNVSLPLGQPSASSRRLDDLEKTAARHAELLLDARSMCRHRSRELSESIGTSRGQVDQHIDRLGRRIDTLERRLVWLAVISAGLFVVCVIAVTALVLAATS